MQTAVSQVDYTYDDDGIRVGKNADGEITNFVIDSNRDYAQVLEETGLLGLGCLLVLLGMVGRAYITCINSSQTPLRSIAYGLGFGLVAVLVHSFSDFGQHLPANFMLTAIFGALLISIAQESNHTSVSRQRQVTLAGTLLAVVILVWPGLFWFRKRLAQHLHPR